MTFLPAQPAGGMKGKYLPPSLTLFLGYSTEDAPSLSLTQEGQKSGDLPTNKGSALKGSKVIIHPPWFPSSKAHWRIQPDYPHTTNTHFSGFSVRVCVRMIWTR